jgi:chemotaxis protein MotB
LSGDRTDTVYNASDKIHEEGETTLVINNRKRNFSLVSIIAVGLLTACVPAQTYDALEKDYQQLQAQLTGDQAEITKLQGQLKVTFKADVLFPEGGWQLNSQAQATLSKIVPTLQGLQQTRIVVDGYTDNVPVGPELQRLGIVSNLDLSSRRADGVVQYLKSQSVSPNLLSGQGFGETHPVASNDTPQGRAQNRRIEVTLVGPGN